MAVPVLYWSIDTVDSILGRRGKRRPWDARKCTVCGYELLYLPQGPHCKNCWIDELVADLRNDLDRWPEQTGKVL